MISNELGGTVPALLNAKVQLHADKLTSISQAVDLDEILTDNYKCHRKLCVAGDVIEVPGGRLTILSPERKQLQDLLQKWKDEAPDSLTSATDKDYVVPLERLANEDKFCEDGSVNNASSIAFLLETKSASALFLGDALPTTVCRSLCSLGYSVESPLKVDICKLSHHGSKANTSPELLTLVNSKQFVVTTNGARHGLPNKATFARILKSQPDSEILFTYPNLIKEIFLVEEIGLHANKLVAAEEEITL